LIWAYLAGNMIAIGEKVELVPGGANLAVLAKERHVYD
jgi:hypothetical protein